VRELFKGRNRLRLHDCGAAQKAFRGLEGVVTLSVGLPFRDFSRNSDSVNLGSNPGPSAI
jgi:hypothetical protein